MRLHGTVFSQILQMDTGLTVVTPNVLRENCKTAYLLHGLYGNHQSWLDYSMLAAYAMEGNTIYIMPEGGRSFYCDMECGFRYFTYLTEELPEICQKTFRVSGKREDTFILGASMGGYGALRCALTKPGQYGGCGAFSAGCLYLREGLDDLRENGLRPEYAAAFGPQLLQDFRAIFGEELRWAPELEIQELIKRLPKGQAPELYLTCGMEDTFYPDHLRLCEHLRESGVPYLFEDWHAQHDFGCFNRALKRAIHHFGL